MKIVVQSQEQIEAFAETVLDSLCDREFCTPENVSNYLPDLIEKLRNFLEIDVKEVSSEETITLYRKSLNISSRWDAGVNSLSASFVAKETIESPGEEVEEQDPVKRFTKKELEDRADTLAVALGLPSRFEAFMKLDAGELDGSCAEPDLIAVRDMLSHYKK